MIDVRDLTIAFEGEPVLENISLQIPKREITMIMGQSGSGKSVLMKTIEGLYRPSSGSISIDGEDVFSASQKALVKMRKKSAMLFQNSALLDSLTVYQNVALPLVEHSDLTVEEIFELVSEKLELVGLAGIFDKMPSELSGGMKKRVALARAIIMQPDYIIYDEPTTGLDPIIASEIVELIIKLHNSYDIASIIISHDLECLRRLSGRVVMIHDAKIIFDGKYNDFMNSNIEHIRQFLGK